MSRLGKQPVTIPKGVEVTADKTTITVKGPKGTLTRRVHPAVTITVAEGSATVVPNTEHELAGAMWGTFAAHLNNMVHGVTEGFEKKLQIEGVGYRAELKGRTLVLSMGFSHPVEMQVPEGIEALVEKNIITLKGADNEQLGQFAADVRAVKKPEPYKGKGIRYVGEYIIRKQGKKAA
jgi:large subunit ribosomal protein L6